MNKSRYIQSAFALLVLLCLPASARAQSKRWEHNIYQGMGWVNKFVKEDEQNIVLHVGYGINYHIPMVPDARCGPASERFRP
mgnify:CR=1 FL=1